MGRLRFEPRWPAKTCMDPLRTAMIHQSEYRLSHDLTTRSSSLWNFISYDDLFFFWSSTSSIHHSGTTTIFCTPVVLPVICIHTKFPFQQEIARMQTALISTDCFRICPTQLVLQNQQICFTMRFSRHSDNSFLVRCIFLCVCAREYFHIFY